MNTNRPVMWELTNAIGLVRQANAKILPYGYAVALTGGVLFRGYSDNDLDLVIYPLTEVHLVPDYAPAIKALFNFFGGCKLFMPPNQKSRNKLVLCIEDRSKRKIEVFVPSCTVDQRTDELNIQPAPRNYIPS